MGSLINRDRLRRLIPSPVLKARRSLQRRLEERRLRRREPVITESRGALIENANRTAVILCGPYFDQRVPTAGVTYRLGLARGFEQRGVAYELVSLFNLRRLRELPEPLVFISETDYEFLSDSQARELRRYRHYVWVNPWFDGAERLYQKHSLEGLSVSEGVRRRVTISEPAFVFTPVSESGLEHYAGWVSSGHRLVSLPLACDTTLYERQASPLRFADVRVAFVGGYWPYKARSFDLYLKPYEQHLTVFGYARWPYAGYGGRLSAEDEPLLYRDAALAPAINEPHAPIIGGDICERVYKVLGSGGLCVTDVTRAHRDLFGEEELLVPETIDDYHDIVRAVIGDPGAFASYRDAGYRAVRARHTYAHRAACVLEQLGLHLSQSTVSQATASPTGAAP
jgi:hypothetical protein